MHKKIRLARVHRELLLDDLAAGIGRSKTLVSFILNGKRRGTDAQRKQLAAMLGLSVAQFNLYTMNLNQEQRAA